MEKVVGEDAVERGAAVSVQAPGQKATAMTEGPAEGGSPLTRTTAAAVRQAWTPQVTTTFVSSPRMFASR